MSSPRPTARTGSSSFWQLVRERRTRDALYHASTYWDSRAAAREGLARSLWPSNVFNELWDERQREILDRVLGPLAGLRAVDIGCGTGRMSRYLASRGASEVLGVDFSAATCEVAREETERAGLEQVGFARGDVLAGLDDLGVGSFDLANVLGCLSVACQEPAALEQALRNIARLVKLGGRVLLLEPIHRSPLLRRVLDLGIEEWVAAANRAGLELESADRMGFVPARLLLSMRDLPRPLVAPLFRAGEALLDRAPYLAPLSDYKLLVFRHGSGSAPHA
jgi:SAM-dependent methyltransferase